VTSIEVPASYRITRGTDADRAHIRSLFSDMDVLSPELADLAITAWATSWRSSAFLDPAMAPFDAEARGYPLVQHVNDTAFCGKQLAAVAVEHWGCGVSNDVLLSVLLLHDVDKLLLYGPKVGGVDLTPVSKVFPHGVLGAMLLHELGFPDSVTAIVATHAQSSPFHNGTLEAWILYYADLFAADHALLSRGMRPLYQRRRVDILSGF
jgi:hypothetical protein